jgi:hypothetical protein
MASNAKQRLESLSRHLTGTPEQNQPPKFELEEHPVGSVRSLKVNAVLRFVCKEVTVDD